MTAQNRLRRLVAVLATALVSTVALAACGNDSTASEGPAGSDGESAASFPVEFTNADGSTTTIDEQPERILSTTVSVTGTLLAFDAPVVSSATDANVNFFAQWASVADENGVEKAWPAEAVNVEAAIAADPDLIIVSNTGGDSAIDQLADFQAIAPTIVVDYSKQTWQDLATQLGEVTGMQDEVAAVVAEYDAYLEDAAAKVTVPSGTANIVAFNGPTDNNPIGMTTGPHAKVLEALGFEIEEPDPAWHTIPQKRSDFVFASYDNLTQLKSETTFILAVDDEGAKKFPADPVMANVPSVKAGQVYALGKNSLRVDYFSAKEIIDGVVKHLGN